jgi:hypothetical protein
MTVTLDDLARLAREYIAARDRLGNASPDARILADYLANTVHRYTDARKDNRLAMAVAERDAAQREIDRLEGGTA